MARTKQVAHSPASQPPARGPGNGGRGKSYKRSDQSQPKAKSAGVAKVHRPKAARVVNIKKDATLVGGVFSVWQDIKKNPPPELIAAIKKANPGITDKHCLDTIKELGTTRQALFAVDSCVVDHVRHFGEILTRLNPKGIPEKKTKKTKRGGGGRVANLVNVRACLPCIYNTHKDQYEARSLITTAGRDYVESKKN